MTKESNRFESQNRSSQEYRSIISPEDLQKSEDCKSCDFRCIQGCC